MNLAQLPKLSTRKEKRIGRGHGSGRGGHTATRGTKGQKNRNTIGLFFEGTKVKKSLIKRLPLIRGKGKFKPQDKNVLVLKVADLNVFEAGEVVNLASLEKKGFLPSGAKGWQVKILGTGELKHPLTIALPVSKGAKAAIEKAGGKVEE